MLGVRKQELENYLREEHQSWREEATNMEGRFLRSRMRLDLLPVIERLFPRAVEHLAKQGLELQLRDTGENDPVALDLGEVFQATGLRLKRSHWDVLRQKRLLPDFEGEIHLSQGWKLVKFRS